MRLNRAQITQIRTLPSFNLLRTGEQLERGLHQRLVIAIGKHPEGIRERNLVAAVIGPAEVIDGRPTPAWRRRYNPLKEELLHLCESGQVDAYYPWYERALVYIAQKLGLSVREDLNIMYKLRHQKPLKPKNLK